MPSARVKTLSVVAVVLVTTVAVVFTLMPGDVWRKWRARRYAGMATTLERSGAKDAARLASLRALALDRDCLPATRTLLATLPPDALRDAVMLRVRLADLDPGDRDNLRELGRMALAVGRFDLAERVAGDLGHALGEVSEVLELRARIPAARGDFAAAGLAAGALLEREPGSIAGRLILALAHVFTGAETGATEKELTALSSDKSVRLEALRGLRDLALRGGDTSRALALAEEVIADQHAIFPDWMAHAELALRARPERAEALLAELTRLAGGDLHALGRIAVWLRQSGHPERIEPWIAGHEALRRDPLTVELIRAETFAAQREWQKLEALLVDAKWGNLDFLRLALHARAARGQGRELAFTKSWHAAITAAMDYADAPRMLADAVRTWPECGEELEELLWRASKKGLQNAAWALSELSQRALARKDTRLLRRVSEAMVEGFPENRMAMNNWVFYSLLLGLLPDSAHRRAEELYLANPGVGAIASTFALSLLRQGRAVEALEVLERLPPAVLQSAAYAPYHALALLGANLPEKARARATQVVAADLLPEEVALLRERGLFLKQ